MSKTNYATELPAGYVDLGYAAIHMSQLLGHSADITRFTRDLPLAIELEKTEPNSPEAMAVFECIDDVYGFTVSLLEFAAVLFALGDELDDLKEGAR